MEIHFMSLCRLSLCRVDALFKKQHTFREIEFQNSDSVICLVVYPTFPKNVTMNYLLLMKKIVAFFDNKDNTQEASSRNKLIINFLH